MERAKHSCVMFCVAALAVAAALCFGAPARAQALLDEVRLGVMAHSIEPDHSEGGVDVNLELLFRRAPISYGNAFADFFLRPRLHVGASLNTIGDTSQVYAGLTWDLKLTGRLSLEASFGGSWHDGPLNGSNEDLYGCRVNFAMFVENTSGPTRSRITCRFSLKCRARSSARPRMFCSREMRVTSPVA